MSILQKLQESMLIEGLDTVYHATDIKALKDILKFNEIELSPNVADSELDISDKYQYFLSTMRNKSGSYMLGIEGHKNKIRSPMQYSYMELDESKLSANLTHIPVDYWGNKSQAFEQEERYFSNDSELINANKYIKSIHILINTERVKERDVIDIIRNPDAPEEVGKTPIDHDMKDIYSIQLLAKNKDIPVYFYDTPQRYIAGKLPLNGFDSGVDYVPNLRHQADNTSTVLKLMSGEKLNTEEVDILKKLSNNGYADAYPSFINDIQDTIHTSRKGGRRGSSAALIKPFLKLMKQYNKKTVKDFIMDVVKPEIDKRFKK